MNTGPGPKSPDCRCVSVSQFTLAGFAVAQFGVAYSLIAQIGIYIDKGYGQLVVSVSQLLGML